MPTYLALDPKLGLSAADFVAAWNRSEHKASYGSAQVEEAQAKSFLSPEVTVALIAAAATIPATIIATFVADFLRQEFLEPDKPPKVTVTTIETPDGEPLLVIRSTESSKR